MTVLSDEEMSPAEDVSDDELSQVCSVARNGGRKRVARGTNHIRSPAWQPLRKRRKVTKKKDEDLDPAFEFEVAADVPDEEALEGPQGIYAPTTRVGCLKGSWCAGGAAEKVQTLP